jgi:hypothetical protein
VSDLKLQADEQSLLDKLEGGDYESVLTDERREQLQAAAADTFIKGLLDVSANKHLHLERKRHE